jgi:hypothetical protein
MIRISFSRGRRSSEVEWGSATVPTAPLASDSSPGFSIYATYIRSELAGEEQRRQAIEARATSIIATSGTLATLIGGVIAIAAGNDKFKFPVGAKWALGAALGLFVVAAILALVANVTRGIFRAGSDDLKKVVDGDGWNDSLSKASLKLAHVDLKSLKDAANVTIWKSKFLWAATLVVIAAIAALAVAAVWVVSALN